MISIIKSVILNNIRDRKNFVFMIVFPVFLVFFLGNLLSGALGGSGDSLKNIEVHYIDQGNDTTKAVLEAFKDMSYEEDEDMRFNLIEEEDLDKAKDQVRINKTILIHLNGDKIDFYSNSTSITKPSLVYGTINAISRRFNAVTEVYKLNHGNVGDVNISTSKEEYFLSEKISSKYVNTAMGYYGVAEIGLMIFYFISQPLIGVKEDRKRNIKDRIHLSGISNSKYYLSVYIGNFLFAFGCVNMSYLICKFALEVNYGNNPLILPVAAIPFIAIIVGLGTLISALAKKEEKVDTVINVANVVIIFLTFIGGGYIAIVGADDSMLSRIGAISPLKWFNNSIFQSIYASNNTVLYNWLIYGGVITAVLCILIVMLGRREDKSYE